MPRKGARGAQNVKTRLTLQVSAQDDVTIPLALRSQTDRQGTQMSVNRPITAPFYGCSSVTESSVTLPPVSEGAVVAHNHLDNQLLARLDRSLFALVEKHLRMVDLDQGHVIAETHQTIENVYFPHGGIISCVVQLTSGGAIETAMIGKDGEFGAVPALDHKVSMNHVVMQVPGTVSTIDADRLRHLAQEHPSLRETLLCYEQFFVAHVQQTAACNAVHNVASRTCKWLLRMQRLVGNDIPLTQEFLSQMMGVARSSVNKVAGELQDRGMITYSRGHVRIIDTAKIKQQVCECDDAISSHYARLFDQ
jgi:CRP-like cAMP-binding protein